jgi:OmpA-OmpF porin, OOP family
MKKILLLTGIVALSYNAFSQNNSYKRPQTIGFSFMFNDFKTIQKIKTSSLSSVLADGSFSRLNEMAPGLAINYFEGITDHIDFQGSLGGTFARVPFKTRATPNFDYVLLGLDANVNVKLLSDRYKFTPYLTTGVGVSYYKIHFGSYIPVGGGLQYRISDDAVVHLQTQYRIALTTENLSDHLNFQFGISTPLKKRAAPPAPKVIPPVEKDTDGDGIFDSKDKCPTVKGVAKYDGCPVPDTDNDGINDDEDNCPTVAGTAKYKGCPVPDTDGDKINDDDDKCPTVAGLARYQGCPIPDTDGDGVNDEEDKCINEAGPRSNGGCPVKEPKKEDVEKVEKAATFIYFETGSAKLKTTSYKALDEVVSVLKKDAELNLDIEGHTDITGPLALNNRLSKQRAESVKSYLAGKGIADSRMSAEGFGPSQPVASNDTAAGRAKNRRVVLKLRK